MDIEYRPTSNLPEELRYIAEIDSRIPIEFDSHYNWHESNVTKRLEDYKSLKPTDFFHVAVVGSEVVGFHIVREVEFPTHMGNVLTLWVGPKYRKKGVAKKLKELSEDWAKKRKVKYIQTAVHVNNKTMLKLNETLGFEKTYELLRKYI